MNRLNLAVSGGDPQGIGPCVTLQAVVRLLEDVPDVVVHVFAPRDSLQEAAVRCGETLEHERLVVVDVPFVADGPPPSAAGGAAALASLDGALSMVRQGKAGALVTAPLSKEAVAAGLPGFTGHTEYLAEKAGCKVLMMLANARLRVALATTHLPLGDVAKRLDPRVLSESLTLLRTEVSRHFVLESPRIAVLALNPHAGEGGLLGDEEEEVIRPAIRLAGGEEAGFFGPFSADTFFLPGRFDAFDVVFAMYHDQGLIPVKMLGPSETVNITLGLPWLRTSPDHGTAFDLPSDVLPDARSMRAALDAALAGLRARQ